MPPPEPTGPDLHGVISDANAVGLDYVVIGAFGVVYHGYIRATKDSDLLVSDGPATDAAVLRFFERTEARRLSDDKVLSASDVDGAEHLRVYTRHGIVDILRGGLPPLDYESVASAAELLEFDGERAAIANLRSLVGLKRLAGRPQDHLDLEKLEAIYGELPTQSIPGVDD